MVFLGLTGKELGISRGAGDLAYPSEASGGRFPGARRLIVLLVLITARVLTDQHLQPWSGPLDPVVYRPLANEIVQSAGEDRETCERSDRSGG